MAVLRRTALSFIRTVLGTSPLTIEWHYSTFHRLVEEDIYSSDWAGSGNDELSYVAQHAA
jgi:hypothetical protein